VNFDDIIERAGTDCYKWDARGMVFGNPDVLPLSVADMDLPCPPAVTQAVQARAAHPVYGYGVHPGSYYQSAIGWFRRRHGWDIERAWMVNTPGVVPALAFGIRAFAQMGGGVVIQTPVYKPFHDLVTMNSRRVEANRLLLRDGRYEIDFTDLDARLALPDVSLLLFCSPHNPVGRVWRRDELERVVQLCRRHGVVLMSDEIHCDLVYPSATHIPTLSLGPEAAACTLANVAPSKTFNIAGLTTALLVAPDAALRERYTAAQYACGLWMANFFGVTALEAAYNEGEAWLDELLAYLQGNLNLIRGYLAQHIPGIRLIEPQATYLAWLDCRGLNLPQDELAKLFIERAGLGLDNGERCGPDGGGFMRLNNALPQPRLLEALQRLERAIKE